MKTGTLLILFLFCLLSCKNKQPVSGEKFDKVKWAMQVDAEYPFRDGMLNDLIRNYTLSGIKKSELIDLLGPANRIDADYLFYTIKQPHLGAFVLSNKSLVIKLSKDSTVEWRKIHE